ncbi:uncharacterized protein [Lepeophtheirus salmonis]|uniref:uncharacterized protein isoform X1 n=2 Tax=Lepeophtheirus salmonis TaxID=72036 RepID=UPI001AE61D27|nr:uncharacterized protein LOC121122888 isoform X2 [Lepeophtheirus salmonis]
MYESKKEEIVSQEACQEMLCIKPRRELTEEQLQERIHLLLLIKRTLYTLITITLGILLIVQVVQCIIKYINKPTYMSSKVVNQYNGEFPAISICPWDPYYKVDVLKEDYNLTSVGHFNKMTDKQENLIWHNKYGQDIIGNITFHLDDLLSDLKIRALRTLNDTLSQTIHPKIQNLKYKEKLHRKFGKCYSLNLSNETGDRGIYYVKMKLKKNIKLYIHADDQFLDLSGRMGYEIRLGETTKAQVNYQAINTIPGGTNRFNCSYNSFDDCMYNSMKERMLSEYGCIAPWIPHTDPRDKTCYTTKDKLGVYKIIYNRWNDCLDPCHYMIVNVGGKTVNPATKDTYVYLYFAHRVLVTKEHYLYDLLSLFAEIGGYCGLFLGYSAYHIALVLGSIINTAIKDYEKRHRKHSTVKQTIKL